MNEDKAPDLLCPVVYVTDVEPCPAAELDPLIAWLESEAAPVNEPKAFVRGTVLPSDRLDLCKQSVGPEGAARLLQALGSSSPIRHVLLGTDGLGDQGARSVASHVEEHDSLETVYLGCNAIGIEGLRALGAAVGESRRARALWLKRNPVRPAGARVLAEMLTRNEGLRTLDVTNTELTDEGVTELCRAATGHPSLEHLCLGANGVTPAAAPSVSALLAGSPGLRSLMLGVNYLGNEGARILADGLKRSRLSRLDLSSNGIGPVGLRALVDSMADLDSLQHLGLGSLPSSQVLQAPQNLIGDEGAELLGQYLASDPSLLSLYVDHNGLSTHGAKAIEAALETNSHLSEIRFGKGIGRKTRRRIRAMLARNGELHPRPGAPKDVRVIRSVYRTA